MRGSSHAAAWGGGGGGGGGGQSVDLLVGWLVAQSFF